MRNILKSARPIVWLPAAVLGLGTSSPAWAQDAEVLPETADVEAAMKAPEAPKPEGWHFKLKLGATLGYGHSSNVVGNPDGSTVQFGALLDAAAEYRGGPHEWSNTLAIAHQQTKTPVLDPFVKTLDSIEFQSLYLYKLANHPWMGPFGRFRLTSVLFPGHFIHPRASDIPTDSEEKFELTGAFEPLILRESAGIFARPVEKETITVRFLVGPGAKQIIVRDGQVVSSVDESPAPPDPVVVVLAPLQDSSQVGGEFEGEATGKIGEPVTWGFKLNLFYPFVTDKDVEGVDGVDKMSVEIGAKLSVKLAKWASLDYVLAAVREPFVVDKWQVTNNLLLTTGFEVL